MCIQKYFLKGLNFKPFEKACALIEVSVSRRVEIRKNQRARLRSV
jgi:hypothetical protein